MSSSFDEESLIKLCETKSAYHNGNCKSSNSLQNIHSTENSNSNLEPLTAMPTSSGGVLRGTSAGQEGDNEWARRDSVRNSPLSGFVESPSGHGNNGRRSRALIENKLFLVDRNLDSLFHPFENITCPVLIGEVESFTYRALQEKCRSIIRRNSYRFLCGVLFIATLFTTLGAYAPDSLRSKGCRTAGEILCVMMLIQGIIHLVLYSFAYGLLPSKKDYESVSWWRISAVLGVWAPLRLRIPTMRSSFGIFGPTSPVEYTEKNSVQDSGEFENTDQKLSASGTKTEKVSHFLNQNFINHRTNINLMKPLLSRPSMTIEAFLVAFSVISLFLIPKFPGLWKIHLFRAMRLVELSSSFSLHIRLLVATFEKSVRIFFSLFVLLGLFYFTFAIIGTQLFKDNFSRRCIYYVPINNAVLGIVPKDMPNKKSILSLAPHTVSSPIDCENVFNKSCTPLFHRIRAPRRNMNSSAISMLNWRDFADTRMGKIKERPKITLFPEMNVNNSDHFNEEKFEPHSNDLNFYLVDESDLKRLKSPLFLIEPHDYKHSRVVRKRLSGMQKALKDLKKDAYEKLGLDSHIDSQTIIKLVINVPSSDVFFDPAQISYNESTCERLEFKYKRLVCELSIPEKICSGNKVPTFSNSIVCNPPTTCDILPHVMIKHSKVYNNFNNVFNSIISLLRLTNQNDWDGLVGGMWSATPKIVVVTYCLAVIIIITGVLFHLVTAVFYACFKAVEAARDSFSNRFHRLRGNRNIFYFGAVLRDLYETKFPYRIVCFLSRGITVDGTPIPFYISRVYLIVRDVIIVIVLCLHAASGTHMPNSYYNFLYYFECCYFSYYTMDLISIVLASGSIPKAIVEPRKQLIIMQAEFFYWILIVVGLVLFIPLSSCRAFGLVLRFKRMGILNFAGDRSCLDVSRWLIVMLFVLAICSLTTACIFMSVFPIIMNNRTAFRTLYTMFEFNLDDRGVFVFSKNLFFSLIPAYKFFYILLNSIFLSLVSSSFNAVIIAAYEPTDEEKAQVQMEMLGTYDGQLKRIQEFKLNSANISTDSIDVIKEESKNEGKIQNASPDKEIEQGNVEGTGLDRLARLYETGNETEQFAVKPLKKTGLVQAFQQGISTVSERLPTGVSTPGLRRRFSISSLKSEGNNNSFIAMQHGRDVAKNAGFRNTMLPFVNPSEREEKMRRLRKQIDDKSLWILPNGNKFRVFLASLIVTEADAQERRPIDLPENTPNPHFYGLYYQIFLVLVTLCACVTSVLWVYPRGCHPPKDKAYIRYLQTRSLAHNLDIFFASILCFDFVLKVLMKGLFSSGDNRYWFYGTPYFQDALNWLDFIVFVVALIIIKYDAVRVLWFLKLLPLLQYFKEVRIFVSAIFAAVPALTIASVACVYWMFVFAVIGVLAFQGKMGRCSEHKDPEGNYVISRDNCSGRKLNKDFLAVALGWYTIIPSFDNTWYGLIYVTQLSSLTQWTELSTSILNIVGKNMQPIFLNSHWNIIYVFIGSVMFTPFLLHGVFIGIIVCSLDVVKRMSHLSSCQREWAVMKQLIHKTEPISRPTTYRFKLLERLNNSKFFEGLIFCTIIANMILGATVHHGQKLSWSFVQLIFQNIILAIFTVEMVVKILGHGLPFFKSSWNFFDFIFTILPIIEDVYNITRTKRRGVCLSAQGRTIRLLYYCYTSRWSQTLSVMMLALRNCFGALLTVIAITFIIVLIFSVLGMELLSAIGFHKRINANFNFRSFDMSVYSTMRMLFVNGLSELAIETYGLAKRPCSHLKNIEIWDRYGNKYICPVLNQCVSMRSIGLYVFFFAIARDIFYGFMSAVLLDSFKILMTHTRSPLRIYDIQRFRRVWMTMPDPETPGPREGQGPSLVQLISEYMQKEKLSKSHSQEINHTVQNVGESALTPQDEVVDREGSFLNVQVTDQGSGKAHISAPPRRVQGPHRKSRKLSELKIDIYPIQGVEFEKNANYSITSQLSFPRGLGASQSNHARSALLGTADAQECKESSSRDCCQGMFSEMLRRLHAGTPSLEGKQSAPKNYSDYINEEDIAKLVIKLFRQGNSFVFNPSNPDLHIHPVLTVSSRYNFKRLLFELRLMARVKEMDLESSNLSEGEQRDVPQYYAQGTNQIHPELCPPPGYSECVESLAGNYSVSTNVLIDSCNSISNRGEQAGARMGENLRIGDFHAIMLVCGAMQVGLKGFPLLQRKKREEFLRLQAFEIVKKRLMETMIPKLHRIRRKLRAKKLSKENDESEKKESAKKDAVNSETQNDLGINYGQVSQKAVEFMQRERTENYPKFDENQLLNEIKEEKNREIKELFEEEEAGRFEFVFIVNCNAFECAFRRFIEENEKQLRKKMQKDFLRKLEEMTDA